MGKYKGTVRHTDLEGGGWTLITDQGVTYQLTGGGKDLLQDGVKAEITGRLATDQVGITMVGDVLEVESYRLLG